MKLNLVFFLSLLLAIPLVSFAATNTSKNVKIESPTIVANKQLKPGTYKLEWSGNGPKVQVAFFRNHKEVLTAPAKLLHESSASSPAQYGPAVEVHKNSKNTNVLDEIDFKNMALNFHRVSTGA